MRLNVSPAVQQRLSGRERTRVGAMAQGRSEMDYCWSRSLCPLLMLQVSS